MIRITISAAAFEAIYLSHASQEFE